MHFKFIFYFDGETATTVATTPATLPSTTNPEPDQTHSTVQQMQTHPSTITLPPPSIDPSPPTTSSTTSNTALSSSELPPASQNTIPAPPTTNSISNDTTPNPPSTPNVSVSTGRDPTHLKSNEYPTQKEGWKTVTVRRKNSRSKPARTITSPNPSNAQFVRKRSAPSLGSSFPSEGNRSRDKQTNDKVASTRDRSPLGFRVTDSGNLSFAAVVASHTIPNRPYTLTDDEEDDLLNYLPKAT